MAIATPIILPPPEVRFYACYIPPIFTPEPGKPLTNNKSKNFLFKFNSELVALACKFSICSNFG